MKHQHETMKVFSDNKGFTLIEVIIALTILTIGILSVNAMQIVSVRGNHTANRLTTAATWATDRAEILFNLEYDDGDLIDGGGGVADGVAGLDNGLTTATEANADGSDNSPDGEYTIYWNIADNFPMDNLKTIRVIIIRNDLGTRKTLVLNHMKSKFM